MIARLTLELPEDVAQVRHARRMTTCLLEGYPVPPQDIEDVEVVVGEICSNVVRHARSQEGHYRVVLELFEDRLAVTVEDRGAGYDPPQSSPPPGSLRPDTLGRDADGEAMERHGGLGLPLAQALTDMLTFRPTTPSGTTVYAEKRIRRAA